MAFKSGSTTVISGTSANPSLDAPFPDYHLIEGVKIGTQIWMAKNLAVINYRDGTPIPCIANETAEADVWEGLSTGACTSYHTATGADPTPEGYELEFGLLYNWFAVNGDDGGGSGTRELAPEGWHIPSDEEFKTLEMYLGMSETEADDTGSRGTDEGSKLAGENYIWIDGDLNADSEFSSSGFNGLPAGYRNGSSGSYSLMGNYGYFWSSSEYFSNLAWYRALYYNYPRVSRNYFNKQYGFSIRCIRDTI